MSEREERVRLRWDSLSIMYFPSAFYALHVGTWLAAMISFFCRERDSWPESHDRPLSTTPASGPSGASAMRTRRTSTPMMPEGGDPAAKTSRGRMDVRC